MSQVPAERHSTVVTLDTLEDLAGDGLDFTSSDLKIPFLKIVQALSPEMRASDAAYNPDAREGMVVNSLTGELFDGAEGITIIPCVYKKVSIEWRPRKQGGGLQGVRPYYKPDYEECIKDENFNFVLPNGNILEETAEYYVLQIKDRAAETYERAVIAMSRSQLEPSRKLNTLIAKVQSPNREGTGFFTPPLYASEIILRTVTKTKDGNSYSIWLPQWSTLTTKNLLQAAFDFRTSVMAGSVEVERKVETDVTDEEVPF
jgi:hypothetical protein